MIISIHIPKTAGTTLASILDYAVDRRILYDYRQLVPNDREEIVRLRPFLERFSVIHGHFHFKKYAGVFPEARFVATLRDPVERTISNYFHLLRSKDTKYKNYQRIVEGDLDLVGFSQLGNVRRAQSTFLEGSSLDDFAVVGLTEDMRTTVRLIRKILGLPIAHPTLLGRLGWVPKTNRDHTRLLAQLRHGFVTPSIRREVRRNLAEDWEWYVKAKERFQQLAGRHL